MNRVFPCGAPVRALASALMFTPALVAAATPGATLVSRAELESLQAQVQALADRLTALEATNVRLQGENAELDALADRRRAEVEALQARASAAAATPAPSAATGETGGAGWATRIKARGDLRYRHARLTGERVVDGTAFDVADRIRDRIRARLGFDATVTDSVTATLRLATGGEDPRGTNQTLGGMGSRKPIGLDLAYADWRFMEGGRLVLGKQPYPVWQPLNQLFLDSDFNPEGGAVRFDRGRLFANAYGFWLTEQYSADPDGENSDASLFGLQVGTRFPALGGETTTAASYYVCGSCRDHSPLYANFGNGNTTYAVGTVNVLRYGYEIAELNAQWSSTALDLPLTLTGGYARNLADDVVHDTAWALGAYLGRAGAPRTWEAGLLYQSIDKDALFGQIADSDFGAGLTDSSGWVFKGGYAPVKNVVLNASYFLNTVNEDAGTELDFTRLQLDVNFRF